MMRFQREAVHREEEILAHLEPPGKVEEHLAKRIEIAEVGHPEQDRLEREEDVGREVILEVA